MATRWAELQELGSRPYTCGYCGNNVASASGYQTVRPSGSTASQSYIYICHYCDKPTYFPSYRGDQVPGPAFGGTIDHIDSEEVEALYDEARNCMKVNAYTAAVMCCRKLLMNVAVSEGAREGLKFWQYVKYLADEGHLPVRAKIWVNHIKDKGNDANHEIKMMGREDAEQLIKFSELLLKTMYEYPAEVENRTQGNKLQTRPQNIGSSGSNPARGT